MHFTHGDQGQGQHMSKSGVIYQFKFPHTNCPDEYIGKSGRIFGHRLREQLRAPSPIHQHSQTMGHPIDLEYFTLVDSETQGVAWTIMEAMYIQVNDPSFNRNLGNYQLPHMRWGTTGYFFTVTQVTQHHQSLPQWAQPPPPYHTIL